jgi:hypothetical protein
MHTYYYAVHDPIIPGVSIHSLIYSIHSYLVIVPSQITMENYPHLIFIFYLYKHSPLIFLDSALYSVEAIIC